MTYAAVLCVSLKLKNVQISTFYIDEIHTQTKQINKPHTFLCHEQIFFNHYFYVYYPLLSSFLYINYSQTAEQIDEH